MNNREQFESWVSDNGKFQRALERKGDTYLLATINTQWEAWQAASKASEQQLSAVVAENAGLKSAVVRIFNYGYQHGHESTVEGNYVDIHRNDISEYHEDIVAEIAEEQTPATDAFLTEVRAQGVDMFGQYHNFSEKLFIQKEAKKFAAQLRQGAAL